MRLLLCTLALHVAVLGPLAGGSGDESTSWPRRVLLTNDDGIGDEGLHALARAFVRVADTWVVAPSEDKSGTGSLMTFWRRPSLTVETRDIGGGVRGYGVDGYPADCVLFALTGLLRDTPPDLVISGINRRPNLADFWVVSGTIGAARMAAIYGVPAIAVSGLDRRAPDDAAPLLAWLVRLAQSQVVRRLKPPQYLTVSLPPASLGQVAGVRVARRTNPPSLATLQKLHTFKKRASPGPDAAAGVWDYEFKRVSLDQTPADDMTLNAAGYIVLVPMRVDEHDDAMFDELRAGIPALTRTTSAR